MGWFVLLVWFVSWVGTPIVALNKHRSVGGWLILGIVFGIFAFVTILLLAPLPDDAALDAERAATRECPHCLSRIPKGASVCRYCQRDVPVPTGNTKEGAPISAAPNLDRINFTPLSKEDRSRMMRGRD